MDTKVLNQKKSELLASQELMLNQAQEAHVALTPAQEESFKNASAEITSIDTTLARMEAIAKSKAQIQTPASEPFIAGANDAKALKISEEYRQSFWNYLRDPSKLPIQNAALGEGAPPYAGSDGGFLVPTETLGTIIPLAPYESAARRLSMVIETEMDLKIPAQATRTVAAAKAESRTSNNPFAGTPPSFANVTLSAYMAGAQVSATWELLQDVPALEAFITSDLARGIQNYEESKFINGSGTGEPLGYLNGGQTVTSTALGINSILDLTGQLNSNYYTDAKFLMNRRTLASLFKSQIAASQFQTFITYDLNGGATLLGFPVEFSTQMPVFSTSPAVSGAVLFGSFSTGWVIGDRGGSAIRAKVLDQVSAVNGVTVILGWRRTDQRCRLAEAIVEMSVTG